MNIVERGRQFLHTVRDLATRSAWDGRRCPTGGDTLPQKGGTSCRHPGVLTGRQTVVVPRHWWTPCRKTSSEQSALLVRGGGDSREVRRCVIDPWHHRGSSGRALAADLRSFLGHPERWLRWRPRAPVPVPATTGHRSARSVPRWLDRAGQTAPTTVADQLAAVPRSG